MADNVREEVKTDKLSADGTKRREFITELADWVRQDDRDRGPWKNKQVVASNQRLGVRRKTNSPYPGYEEVPVPTTDKVIKQKKAIFLSVATVPNKQVQVTVDPSESSIAEARVSANKIETAINNIIRKKDFGWTKKVALFIDYFLENGHALFKVIEKFFSKVSHITINVEDFGEEVVAELKQLKDSEIVEVLANRYNMDPDDKEDAKEIKKAIKQFRKGETILKLTRRDYYSEPSVIPVKGLDAIVPNSATDMRNLPRITHDMWVGYEYIKERVDRGVYDESVLEHITPESGTSDDSINNVNYAQTEGVSNSSNGKRSGLFNIRECQTYYEDSKTGKLDKWVFTWIEHSGNTNSDDSPKSAKNDIIVLQESKLEYEHGFFTYVKHDHEYKNVRWYASRGVPEQIRGMHIITEKMFNNRVIRDEMNNAPMFRVSKQLGWSGDEIRFRPGQMLEADAGEIEQINKANTADFSSSQIESQAKAYIEEYQAIPDLGQSNANNKEKTATEVDAIRAALAQQANTETALFLESLSEVAQHLYWIIKQSVQGPTYVGGVLLNPEDFRWKMQPSWIGSIEASNVSVRSAKILEKIQIAMQIGVPMGLVSKENLYNMLRKYYEADPDIENVDDWITQPQEMLVEQTEDQMNELIMMQNGFNPQVKPDDDHTAHIQVIEQWVQTPEGNAAMQNPQIAERVQTHLNVHISAEQEQQNLPKGQPGGADLASARRSREI